MTSYIENGYEYTNVEESSFSKTKKAKGDSSSTESISLWLWFIIVFVFAIVTFISIWYIPKHKRLSFKNFT